MEYDSGPFHPTVHSYFCTEDRVWVPKKRLPLMQWAVDSYGQNWNSGEQRKAPSSQISSAQAQSSIPIFLGECGTGELHPFSSSLLTCYLSPCSDVHGLNLGNWAPWHTQRGASIILYPSTEHDYSIASA